MGNNGRNNGNDSPFEKEIKKTEKRANEKFQEIVNKIGTTKLAPPMDKVWLRIPIKFADLSDYKEAKVSIVDRFLPGMQVILQNGDFRNNLYVRIDKNNGFITVDNAKGVRVPVPNVHALRCSIFTAVLKGLKQLDQSKSVLIKPVDPVIKTSQISESVPESVPQTQVAG